MRSSYSLGIKGTVSYSQSHSSTNSSLSTYYVLGLMLSVMVLRQISKGPHSPGGLQAAIDKYADRTVSCYQRQDITCTECKGPQRKGES